MVFLFIVIGLAYSWTVERWEKFTYQMIVNGTEDWVELNFTTYANLSTKEIFYTNDYIAPPQNVSIDLSLLASRALNNDERFAVICIGVE